jgi:hypothetical protein
MELCCLDETYLEFLCEVRVSLGCVGACSIVEGEELLAGSYPSNLVSFCDKDILHWSASINVMYSCSHTLDAIRVKRQIVDWWSLVWFPISIPKQASDLVGNEGCVIDW